MEIKSLIERAQDNGKNYACDMYLRRTVAVAVSLPGHRRFDGAQEKSKGELGLLHVEWLRMAGHDDDPGSCSTILNPFGDSQAVVERDFPISASMEATPEMISAFKKARLI